MFRIGPVPPVLDDQLADLAARIDPSTIGHWMSIGVTHGIRPLTSNRWVTGSAFTVRVPGMDAAAIHAAVDDLQPGHVLVVQMDVGTRLACVGGVLAMIAEARGAAGIVIDGMATDLEELEQMSIPVFARGTSIMTTRPMAVEGDVNVPVVIDGSAVRPGDVVIGDANGVLVLPPRAFLDWADKALESQALEVELRDKHLSGEVRLTELSGAQERIQERIVSVNGLLEGANPNQER